MRPQAIAFGILVTAAVFGLKWFLDRRRLNQPASSKHGREDISAGFAASSAERGLHFFYIKIPENIQPLDRGEKYEDPLQQVLSLVGLGEITGGGSQLAEGGVEYCGIDVEVTDRQRGLDLIIDTLRKLDAPAETVVEEYVPAFQEHRVYRA